MLRNVDVSGLEPVEVQPGAPGELAFVAIADLVIDDTYQRGLERRGWSNIEQIAKKFDWSKFSPLMVSRRPDGRLAILDGQHRAHAAALAGVEAVPALIVTLDARQEAAAFAAINGAVTAMLPNYVFKAALAAGEPWAVKSDGVVARAGCRLMPVNYATKDRRPGQVFCIATVRRFVEAGQDKELVAVLRGVVQSPVADQVKYYNTFGLSALVPAAVARGVRSAGAIAAFLADNDLDAAAALVWRLKEQAEYRDKSFRSLFAASVEVLLQKHALRTGAVV